MSTGERILRKTALTVFYSLDDILADVCERIEAAGSLRRQCETVGDVEIVCIPKPMVDLFGKEYYSDIAIKDALSLGGYPPHYLKNGPLYKQFIWMDVKVDLFLTTPPQWGLIFALRTGPAEFSHKLVTKRRSGGLCPSWMEIRDGFLWKDDEQKIETREEIDLFRALGIDWIEPENRS